jgi:hypothetical protein
LAALAAVAVAGGVAVSPEQSEPPETPPPVDSNARTVDVFCPWTSRSACLIGGLLAFKIAGLPTAGHLLAYGVPAAGGDRRWYFSADGAAGTVEAGPDGTRRVPLWARIDDAHVPGEYRVHVLVACRPFPRDAFEAVPQDCVLGRAEVGVTMRR